MEGPRGSNWLHEDLHCELAVYSMLLVRFHDALGEAENGLGGFNGEHDIVHRANETTAETPRSGMFRK